MSSQRNATGHFPITGVCWLESAGNILRYGGSRQFIGVRRQLATQEVDRRPRDRRSADKAAKPSLCAIGIKPFDRSVCADCESHTRIETVKSESADFSMSPLTTRRVQPHERHFDRHPVRDGDELTAEVYKRDVRVSRRLTFGVESCSAVATSCCVSVFHSRWILWA